MKMYLNKIFPLLFSTMIIVTACSKKEEELEPDSTITNTENSLPSDEVSFNTYLHNDNSKTWANGTFNLSGVGIQSCRNDDIITLKNDGTYSYDNGSTSCGGDVQSKTGLWEASFSGSSITFDKGTTEEYVASIISITAESISANSKWSGLTITGTYASQE